jgi:hypothetical protein
MVLGDDVSLKYGKKTSGSRLLIYNATILNSKQGTWSSKIPQELRKSVNKVVLQSRNSTYVLRTYTYTLYTLITDEINLLLHSVALQLFVRPGRLLQFRKFFTQTVGLLGRVIGHWQGRYLNTGQHKHTINAHTDNHALNWFRTHDPSVRENKNSLCLRPRGHCDRRQFITT